MSNYSLTGLVVDRGQGLLWVSSMDHSLGDRVSRSRRLPTRSGKTPRTGVHETLPL